MLISIITGREPMKAFSSSWEKTWRTYTGVFFIMILVGLLFIFLAIKYEFEPML